MTIKLGMQVSQVLPAPVAGTVIKKQFVESTDTFQYLVETPAIDEEGHPLTRWFEEKDIKAIETLGEQA